MFSLTVTFYLTKTENRTKKLGIWKLKENGKNYTIDWLITMKGHPYICARRKSDLCLCKKLELIIAFI